MTSPGGGDLGHGVRVVRGDGGELVVLSEVLEFGWRPRTVKGSGSAVTIDEVAFEVIDRQPWGRGTKWVLEPWSGSDVMRIVLPFNAEVVAAAAETARAEAAAARLRPMLVLLAPFLGFAIDRWQRRWRDTYGYPDVGGTWASAFLEAVFGAVCGIEVIAQVGGGQAIFPWLPDPPLLFVCLYFLPEGLIRIARVAADSEPVGSLVGLLVSVFERRREPERETLPGPTVERFDDVSGALELRSPILRRDWEEEGVLPFRGAVFRSDGARQLGDAWLYRFRRVEGDVDELPHLRLPPPPFRTAAPIRRQGHGLLEIILLTTACTLAPARFQERWAWWMGVPAVGTTVFGAGVELIGGVHGLAVAASPGGLAVVINLFFAAEAALRLGCVVLRGRPMGSVLGLPLVPILNKVLPV